MKVVFFAKTKLFVCKTFFLAKSKALNFNALRLKFFANINSFFAKKLFNVLCKEFYDWSYKNS
jgi:hypothetical protein